MPKHRLRLPTRLGLFASAYLPLFLILALGRIEHAQEILSKSRNNPGWTWRFAVEQLWFPGLAIAFGLAGLVALWLSVRNLERQIRGTGETVQIVDVENRGSEAIGYVGTYILPFVFEDYGSWSNTVALLLLLGVTYSVYVNSSLLVVNPLLRLFRYGLYDVEFIIGGTVRRRGLVLVKEPMPSEGKALLIEPIAHKLYYAVPAP